MSVYNDTTNKVSINGYNCVDNITLDELLAPLLHWYGLKKYVPDDAIDLMNEFHVKIYDINQRDIDITGLVITKTIKY